MARAFSEGCRLPPHVTVIAKVNLDQVAGFFHAREGGFGVLDAVPV
jgi:hypothetical protein